MNVLLIFPQYTHSNEFDSRAPSMSLLYLAAYLEKQGHAVSIFDASLGPVERTGKVYRYGYSDEEVARYLEDKDFDFVGVSCSFTARWRFVANIARQIKTIKPVTPVAIGGLFPTTDWEYCLKESKAIDVVLIGEAERSFADVIKKYGEGCSVADACQDVDGVAWRHEEKIACNPKTVFNDKLDDLPFPAWHLVDLKEYFKCQKSIFELPTPCLPILSSRSCPNRCRFCNMYITHGRRWRKRSAANVLAEFEYLVNKFDIHNFYFVDDNFSISLKRAKEICRGIIDRKLDIKYNFHNGLSIKAVDRELFQLMKESGCTSVCLAIESGSEYIRNEVYGKGLSTEKIINAFQWCHELDLPAIGYFMVGAPGETRRDFLESKKLLARLPMRLMTVNTFTPYPGTELYDECKEKGWLIEPEVNDENRVEMFTSMLRTPDFMPEDVSRWKKELYLSFIWYHWPILLKELFRKGGVVNRDMMGKFFGVLKMKDLKGRNE